MQIRNLAFSARSLFLVIGFCFFKLDSFAQKSEPATLPTSNPFAAVSSLPYEAPDFSKIKDADYQPALDAGLEELHTEMQRIAANPAAPTFENTLVAMEKAGRLLDRVSRVFYSVAWANTNPELQKLQETIAPKMAASQDAILLNANLFKRIETLYKKRSSLRLDAESKQLLERYYQRFTMAGAKLSEADKSILKKLNEEEATLSARFSNLLVNATKASAVLVSDSTLLAGLSENDRAAYAQNAKAKNESGKWLIPLQNTTQQPPLQTLSNRDMRQKLFDASWNRAEKGDSTDTRQVVLRMAAVRTQKAKLLGFPDFATWKLQDQMAKTPKAVDQFFEQLTPAATAKAKQEVADIQSVIDAQKGGFSLQPWDWNFYAEQVRKAKYDLDEREVKPYFELTNVLENGVFYAANQLYGLTFQERHDIPVYQEDVRVYEVSDKDGKPLALFYGDYYKRDNKRGGAWCSGYILPSKLLGQKPVIYNVANLPKPAPGQPALVSFDDVRTMFHEFGHALHAMFANQVYPSLGSNIARDFVEFPSQFNEHWAMDPKILKHYAVHYKTGAVLPQALLDKMKKATAFNSGYRLTELIAASLLDLEWHKLSDTAAVSDVDAFEKTALHKAGINLPQVPPRYRTSYFSHIWSSGYAASYYAYQWTKMLADDAFSWFEENGGLTRPNGQRFRDLILSRGSTIDYNQMYKAFRGHDPDIYAMKKDMGLTAPY